jgi:hypothetical protein
MSRRRRQKKRRRPPRRHPAQRRRRPPFNYKLGINKGVELTTEYNVGNFTLYGNVAIANQLVKGIESAQFNFTPDDLTFADSRFVNTDHRR